MFSCGISETIVGPPVPVALSRHRSARLGSEVDSARVAAASQKPRRASLVAGVKAFVRAIQEDDEAILAAVLRLSRSRRIFAPLAFTVGALTLLFGALKLLLTNWRLMLVQVLPALWIWLAMLDLKLHVLHGRSLNVIRGAILIPIGLAIVAITVGSFFLNAVFAFAIAGQPPPRIRPAFAEARRHLSTIAIAGSIIGALLAIATTVSPRWGRPWFALSLGIVTALMMLTYIAVPARLIGARTTQSKRDKLTASALSGALGATVCTPPYVLGRVGILMLGSRYLLIPGIFVLAVGVTLQAGATGAVRAIKMSMSLAAGRSPEDIAGEHDETLQVAEPVDGEGPG
jgi:hypothetical protein